MQSSDLYRNVKAPLIAIVVFFGVLWTVSFGHSAWLTSSTGKRVFLRGVVYSPHHARQGTNISPAVTATDLHLLRVLGANCILTSRAIGSDQISAWHDRGIDTLRQVQYSPEVMSAFGDGTEAPVPVYVDDDNRQGLYRAARDVAASLKGNQGVLGISLGTSYRWAAFNENAGGFSYAGFDQQTLAAFAQYLQQQFTSVDRFNAVASDEYQSFSEARPPSGLAPSIEFGEWWLFMRQAFSDYIKSGHDGIEAVGADIPVTYQLPLGIRWDPASENCPLEFNDFVSGNVFYKQSNGWDEFCVTIDRLIAIAHGRPVLITETGAQTLVQMPVAPGRIIKQSVACALLHPELAGISLYEFCDDWRRAGDPQTHNLNNAMEHWGLVGTYRDPKDTFRSARHMLHLIRRNEGLFQQWQSPATVLVSDQAVDWWKVRGLRARLYQTVATQLYELGVSFRLADVRTLLNLDPRRNPMLIVCDSFLFNNPDSSRDVQSSLINYVNGGGKLLYVSPTPWQRLYGTSEVPAQLQPPQDKTPVKRAYGDGEITLVPYAEITDHQLHNFLLEFLDGTLGDRAVKAIEPQNDQQQVFWRLFEGPETKWLYAVNVGTAPIGRIEIDLGPDFQRAELRVRESDGGGLVRIQGKPVLLRLDTYALVSIEQ